MIDYLLTPGPLTTTQRTKESMLKDWGSWDQDFNSLTKNLCTKILRLLGPGYECFVCVPMQGSGSFSVEATLGTLTSPDTKCLILANGAYGQRMAKTMHYLKRPYSVIDKGDYEPPRAQELEDALKKDPTISHVCVVHCETSSGILNPIQELSRVAKEYGKIFVLDAMSSFGAIPIIPSEVPFDTLVFSSNKCFEGVPGFGFVIVREEILKTCKNRSHSLSLDLYDQWLGFLKDGKWRFTPPTHVVSAMNEALLQHEEEGSVAGRYKRYMNNQKTMVSGLRAMGFQTLLADEWLSPIITTFYSPKDPAFDFQKFYARLKQKHFLIYPGKLTVAESFRIGHIGAINQDVCFEFLQAMKSVITEMGIQSCHP